MFAFNRRFWKWAIGWGQTNSATTNPCCQDNKIWEKMDYISAWTRDISKIFASNRSFMDRLLDDDKANLILMLAWYRHLWNLAKN